MSVLYSQFVFQQCHDAVSVLLSMVRTGRSDCAIATSQRLDFRIFCANLRSPDSFIIHERPAFTPVSQAVTAPAFAGISCAYYLYADNQENGVS